MPNFKEHLLYSSVILNAILIVGILLLLWDHHELSRHAIILATVIPVLYYIGAIAPDIDATKTNQIVEMLMYALPLCFGGSFWYVTQNYVIGIVAGVLSSVFIYLVKSKVSHRGWIHSISFTIVLSSVIGIIVYNISLDIYISIILALIFSAGFISHLVLDEIRNIKTNGKRALKLW